MKKISLLFSMLFIVINCNAAAAGPADPNAINKKGYTKLYRAVCNQDLEKVKEELENGANPLFVHADFPMNKSAYAAARSGKKSWRPRRSLGLPVRREILELIQGYVDEGFSKKRIDIASSQFSCVKCEKTIRKGTGYVADCRHIVHKKCKAKPYDSFNCPKCKEKGRRKISTIASSLKELEELQKEIKKKNDNNDR